MTWQLNYQCVGPNVEPSGTVLSVTDFQSPVFVNTVFPHQVCILFAPIVPFFGYCRQKKIKMSAIATLESMADERT